MSRRCRSGLLEQRIETTSKVVSILIGSAPYAVWFIIIDHDRQAPGQARLAKLSAERSAGTVFSFCSRRT